MGYRYMNKQEFLDRMGQLFDREEIELVGVDHDFEIDDIPNYQDGIVEHAHTGEQTLTLKILNKKIQEDYAVKRLKGWN